MSQTRSLRQVFEEVKERKIKQRARFSSSFEKCPDTPSESNLVIDDDDDDEFDDLSTLNTPKRSRADIVKAVNEPFKIDCPWLDCNKPFDNYKEFCTHIEEHTLSIEETYEGLFSCQFANCSYTAKEMCSLLKHTDFHCYHERLKSIGDNIVERNSLPKCKYEYNYKIGDIADYICEWGYCKQHLTKMEEFLNHVRLHCFLYPQCDKGEYLHCQWLGCSSKFARHFKLWDHLKQHTKKRTAGCSTCGNIFVSNTKFFDHRKRQIPIQLSSFQCSECSKLFSTERILRDHMRSHVNSYKCTFCDMTCPKPSTLALHIRFRHVSERLFKCSLCQHAALSKAHLEDHMATHSAEKQFACEDCEFRCRSQYSLTRHRTKMHGNGAVNNYECHCCGARFPRGGVLTRHLMKEHDFKWPSGHSRFRYKQDSNGILRLQTVRYESLEVTEQMMNEKPEIISDAKYKMVLNTNSNSRLPVYDLIEASDSDNDSTTNEN